MISKQMLINQLRELKEVNIIERTVFAEVPPRVEYNMSKYGKSVLPVIRTIQKWGIKDMENNLPEFLFLINYVCRGVIRLAKLQYLYFAFIKLTS